MRGTSFPRELQLWATHGNRSRPTKVLLVRQAHSKYRAIMHDPNLFDNPLEFKPERYLMRDPITQQNMINPDVIDPEAASFGYGRRICPGRHLSNEALTLMAASLLAVFNVNAPKDPASGQPIKVKLETGDGIVV
jgi:cytochrome P450